MLYRRLPPILLSALLVACSVQDPVGGLQTDTLRTELPPAELPTYARGDSYTFDNPRETWTVTSIVDGLVTWRSSLGGAQTTVFDPLLPPIKWQKPNTAEGGRRIVEWSGSLFPLKAGNKMTFKSAVHIDFEPGRAVFVWNCYAGHPRRVSVPAGEFAAIPVFCRRNDGRTLLSYYAPALNGTVSVTHGSPKQGETVRNLLAFKVGSGARVAARQPESLPGGWSTAAVVKWDRYGIVQPRLKPELIAVANPPLSFAEPAQIPAPTAETPTAEPSAQPPELRKPDNTALLSTPKIRIPKSTGKFGAHLGSFSSQFAARRAWKILGSRHKSLRQQVDHAIYPIDTGKPKGVLYRLVAGPDASPGPMQALCMRIQREGGYCRVMPIKPVSPR